MKHEKAPNRPLQFEGILYILYMVMFENPNFLGISVEIGHFRLAETIKLSKGTSSQQDLSYKPITKYL